MEWFKQALQILQTSEKQITMAYVLVIGGMYLSLIATIALIVWLVRIFKKRKKSKYPRREVQFTLPDRENSYIRTRLLTTLNTERETNARLEVELPLAFTHAQKLLSRVEGAPLSTAERLELRDLSAVLEGYFMKTRFSALDVHALNTAFLKLLKLSAKYAV